MLNLNVITILMKWRQLKLIHWDTNYFAQSFTSLSDPRLTVRVPPSMKIHLHDNNSEHSECSTSVRATKAANLGIKAFELDSRSTECKAYWKYFLFYFFPAAWLCGTLNCIVLLCHSLLMETFSCNGNLVILFRLVTLTPISLHCIDLGTIF